MQRLLVACMALALFAVALPVRARGGRPSAGLAELSTSVGRASGGRLEGGIYLRETPHLRHMPEYARGGRFFGTVELVGLLHRVARRSASRRCGALSVGELSRQGGGPIDGHRSHQSGRDADLAFFVVDRSGRPMAPWSFFPFDGRGRSLDPHARLRFSDACNWALVSALVSDPEARVQYLFVSNAIGERLLSVGRALSASPSIIERAGRVMIEPTHGHPHRNHFHVRIYCPRGDRPSCLDEPPYHPWYPGRPPG